MARTSAGEPVLGKDRDIGYTLLRVSPEQPWHPIYLLQPFYNVLLALIFEYGIALYDLEVERIPAGDRTLGEALVQLRGIAAKAGRQIANDDRHSSAYGTNDTNAPVCHPGAFVRVATHLTWSAAARPVSVSR